MIKFRCCVVIVEDFEEAAETGVDAAAEESLEVGIKSTTVLTVGSASVADVDVDCVEEAFAVAETPWTESVMVDSDEGVVDSVLDLLLSCGSKSLSSSSTPPG